MNNPDIPKMLYPLKGRPIICHLLDRLAEADFMPPVLVVGYLHEKVRAELGDSFTYIVQEEQLGTGHAVDVCRDALAGKADVFLVMNGDHPLWTAETMKRLVTQHEASGAELSLVTLMTDHPAFENFGRIIRNNQGTIIGIREFKDCTPEEQAINEVNPALYCFNDSWLWDAIDKIDNQNAQKEYYLTDLLAIAIEENHPISSVKASSWQEALGINNLEQLAEAEKWIEE